MLSVIFKPKSKIVKKARRDTDGVKALRERSAQAARELIAANDRGDVNFVMNHKRMRCPV